MFIHTRAPSAFGALISSTFLPISAFSFNELRFRGTEIWLTVCSCWIELFFQHSWQRSNSKTEFLSLCSVSAYMGLQSTAGTELPNKQTALNEKITRSVGTHTSGKALNMCVGLCASLSLTK